MADRFPQNWAATLASGQNAIGTSASQVVGANGQRIAITFHNPGAVNVWVFPTNMTTSAPSSGALGGAYVVYPGEEVTIYGGNTSSVSAVNGAWQAFAASGSTNPLTILESY